MNNLDDLSDLGNLITCRQSDSFNYLVINREYISDVWKKSSKLPVDYQLLTFCQHLFKDIWKCYPDFFQWVNKKVIPGILNDQREIVCVISKGLISGFVVLKNTNKEKKICTLYVEPYARKFGVGTMLLNISKVRLNENKPLITVSEDRVSEFKTIFSNNGFELVGNISDIYQKGKKEFIFNQELIIDESSTINKT